MNYQKIIDALNNSDHIHYDSVNVEIYITYLKFLEQEKDKDKETLKNKWFPYFKDEEAIDIFKKVAKDNVFIDGETITLSNRGKIIVSYNYQAYKNLLLNVYPESTFDIQVVNEGDDFSFFKDSGRVVYSHRLKDPFATNKTIIGTYCIIKNSRGEFLETLNMDDIAKMKAVATTKNIWDQWESEMVLKSVIKRACKRHFRDIVVNVEKLDNENYDLNAVNVDSLVQTDIEKATTFADLGTIYNKNVNSVADKVNFVRLLGERKEKLIELLPEFKTEDETKALELIKKYNGKFDPLLLVWKFTEDQKESLITKFAQKLE
jgi:hypothetical protein